MAKLMLQVSLTLTSEELLNVRFVFGPLWECIVAFRAWQDPARHELFLPWFSRVNSKISGTNWEPLRSLACVLRGTIPDFVSPPPTTPLPRLSDELRNLSRSPVDVVRTEIKIVFPSGVPKILQRALDNPKTFLSNTASLLERFWRLAMAPGWTVL